MVKDMVDDRVTSFYEKNGGDRLVHSDVYTSKIRRYLLEESQLISKLLADLQYQFILEVGCMYGRLLKIAKDAGVVYRGIDLVERFIRIGHKLAENIVHDEYRARLWTCSINDIGKIIALHPDLFPCDMRKTLTVFPFNSFGNIADPYCGLSAIRKCGCDLLICTYTTDINASRARREYYTSCGYNDLEEVQNGQGVMFHSREGLESAAYHPHYLRSLLARCDYAIKNVFFIDPFGVAYLVQPV